MGRFKKWAKTHKGTIAAIVTGFTGFVGIVIWGSLPEKEQLVKAEWIPPVKKNWYLESDD